MRVDNHIRNKLSALITLGHYDSQKEIVEALVNNYIDGLEKSEFKRFEDLVQIYESKDVKKHQKKKLFNLSFLEIYNKVRIHFFPCSHSLYNHSGE